MDLELKNKVVLVTGSSRGIGFGIAKKFAEEGAFVALNGRDGSTLKNAEKNIGEASSCFVADVTKADEASQLVNDVIKKYGRIDVLVCNVGSGTSVKAGTENYEEWQRVLHANFFSATNLVEAARAELAKTRGSIVCISSICGTEIIPGAPATYTVAKAALNFYVRSMARPFAELGIRINAVSPGNINFPGGSWEKRLNDNSAVVEAMLNASVALKRFGKPEEIADVVAFVASSRSAFMTGEVLVVDGGQVHS